MNVETQYEVAFEGNPAIASALAQLFEERGVRVDWERPQEYRDLAGAAEEVIVTILATGSYEAIKAAIAAFRKRFPGARANVEDESDE